MSQMSQTPIFFFEDVLPKTGWGLYYKFMVTVACSCSFVQAISTLSVYFGAPNSVASTADSAFVLVPLTYAVYNIGRASGGFVLNKFSDVYGRKRLISYSLIMVFLGTFVAAFAYHHYMVIFGCFLIGTGLECNVVVIRIHIAEILTTKKRAFYLTLCDVFWSVGYLIFLLFALLFKKHFILENKVLEMQLSSWRIFFALAGSLNIFLACVTALLEESPRWFLYAKKNYLAALTLKQFYAINKSSYGETFKIKDRDLTGLIDDYDINCVEDHNRPCREFKNVLKSTTKSFKLMFKRPFRTNSIVLLLIKTPILFTGIIEMNSLLTKYLDASMIGNGTNGTFCVGSGTNENFSCGDYYYYNMFVIAINVLLGQLLAMLLMNRLGRRILLVLSLFVCGCSLTFLYFIDNNMMKLMVSTQIMTTLGAALTVVSVINIEVYPTALRGMSHSIVHFPGIFLSVFLPYFYATFGNNLTFVLIGLSYLGASIAACFVQELKGQPMIE